MAEGLAIAATCSCIVVGCLFVADGQAQAQTATQLPPAQVTPTPAPAASTQAAPLSPMQAVECLARQLAGVRLGRGAVHHHRLQVRAWAVDPLADREGAPEPLPSVRLR